MEKAERIKRNHIIRVEYEKENREPYIPGKNQPGSAYIIKKLSKKYKLTVSAIYLILKSK